MSDTSLVVNVPQESEPRSGIQKGIWVAIGAVVGFLLEGSVLIVNERWPDVARSLWYYALMAVVLAVISAWLFHLAIEIGPLRSHNEGLRETCTVMNARWECAEKERESLDVLYRYLNEWFELDNLPPDLNFDDPNETAFCLAALHKDQLRVALLFRSLLEQHSADARYRDQIELAGVLSTLAAERFWATSADSVSQFHSRNHYYLQVLDEVSKRISPALYGKVPSLARIFIGKRETFLSEVTSEGQSAVLALYEWHLRWLSEVPCGAVGDECEPLHFFMENDASVGTYFEKHNVAVYPVTDFMVVDDRFIYGRQGEPQQGRVKLAFDSAPETVRSYREVFADLWSNSFTIGEMLDDLLLLREKQDEILAFKEQCKKRQSKLHIARRFASLFSLNAERHGNGFVRKTCEIIGSSKGVCFAVDRADHKAGNILDAWKSDASYLMFMDASKKAAEHASMFQRLYVIDTKLKGNPDDILDFVMESVTASIDVGFCSASAIPTATSAKYDTDFIITDFGTDNAFGFELQDVVFKPEQLEWTKNLIAREWMHNYHNFFWKLWNDSGTVTIDKGSKRHEVREKLRKVLEGGSE
jgi:hypothetical protein